MMLELRIEIMCVLAIQITSSIVYTANGVNFVATVSKEQLNVFSFVSLSSLVVELIYIYVGSHKSVINACRFYDCCKLCVENGHKE